MRIIIDAQSDTLHGLLKLLDLASSEVEEYGVDFRVMQNITEWGTMTIEADNNEKHERVRGGVNSTRNAVDVAEGEGERNE